MVGQSAQCCRDCAEQGANAEVDRTSKIVKNHGSDAKYCFEAQKGRRESLAATAVTTAVAASQTTALLLEAVNTAAATASAAAFVSRVAIWLV